MKTKNNLNNKIITCVHNIPVKRMQICVLFYLVCRLISVFIIIFFCEKRRGTLKTVLWLCWKFKNVSKYLNFDFKFKFIGFENLYKDKVISDDSDWEFNNLSAISKCCLLCNLKLCVQSRCRKPYICMYFHKFYTIVKFYPDGNSFGLLFHCVLS